MGEAGQGARRLSDEPCDHCDFIGPDWPSEDWRREMHRAFHELGRELLRLVEPSFEWLNRKLSAGKVSR